MEFVTTAMPRPGIIRDTYESCAANLRGVDLKASTLYINIDPMPEDWLKLMPPGSGDPLPVVNVAEKFFGKVIVNITETGCFGSAIKWCFARPQGEYFFSWEDDWLTLKPVESDELFARLYADPSLSLVNLRAYRHGDDRLCLAPGLWRASHAKAIAERMLPDDNPEMQLRAKRNSNPHGDLHIGYKGLQYPEQIVLKDIGRLWLAANGLKRDGKRNFVKWAKAR